MYNKRICTSFDGSKYVSFLIKDDDLLKNNKICNNVSNSINKVFDSKSVYNEKYLKTKIKSRKGKTNKN